VSAKLPVFSTDFETTTKISDCRVWLWGYKNVYSDKFGWGTDIDSFIEWVSGRSSICYFHNLKFDGMFIIDWLLRNGYKHSTQKGTAKTFNTLISDMGKMYSMTIYWGGGRKTEFKDSAKKFPNFSVARLAKSFGMEEGKGDIDYHAERPVGYQPTDEEIDYLRRDVDIVGQAIRQALDSGMKKLTIGSDSLHEYKTIATKKAFEYHFPTFGHALDAEIRRAYRGGFTYSDPRFQGGIVGNGVVLDVNSLYPYIMSDRILPYGEPKYVRDKVETSDNWPLSIFAVTFTAKLKPNHIPCIQIKGSSQFVPTDYQRDITEPTQLMVTNVDWELYNEHYDIDVLSYGGGWLFHATRGMFDTYIEKWSEIKQNTTGGRRELAKLHLNSLYGKFASNPNVTSKYPVYDAEHDRVKLVRGRDEKRAPVYTPAGVFITSWARAHTIRAAQANYSMFAYADTDSLHLVLEGAPIKGDIVDIVPTNLDIDDKRFGAWAYEYDFEAAMYLRAKAYSERHYDGTYTTRIAGLPVAVSSMLDFSDIVDGNIIDADYLARRFPGSDVVGKLTPKIVTGGVVLVDTPYKLVVK